MLKIEGVLNDPVVRQGLTIAAPEVVLIADVAMAVIGGLFGSRKKKPTAEMVLHIIDTRLAEILHSLSNSPSPALKRELETRAHELLGILNEWEKIT